VKKIMAKERLDRQAGPTPLTADLFVTISDWYHLALLELTLLEGFESNAPWIARALGISVFEAKGAVSRLKRLGALSEKEGRLRASKSFFVNPAGVPSEAVRKFHEQALMKARDALTLVPAPKRDFSSLSLAMSEADLPALRAEIREFRDYLAQKYAKAKRKDQVYQISLQVFPLANPPKGNNP
jgi:uncharacterized protein (TIGR02147 family)